MEAATTSKYRKRYLVSGDPFEPQAPEVVLVPSPTSSISILVVDLKKDVEGSSPASSAGVPTMVTQTATLPAASLTPIISLEAPTPLVMATVTPTQAGPSSPPPPVNEEPPLRLGTWF